MRVYLKAKIQTCDGCPILLLLITCYHIFMVAPSSGETRQGHILKEINIHRHVFDGTRKLWMSYIYKMLQRIFDKYLKDVLRLFKFQVKYSIKDVIHYVTRSQKNFCEFVQKVIFTQKKPFEESSHKYLKYIIKSSNIDITGQYSLFLSQENKYDEFPYHKDEVSPTMCIIFVLLYNCYL